MYNFQSQQDASQRLKGTVVLFKERPTLVVDVMSRSEFLVRDVMTGRESVEAFTPCDFKRPVLGYMNYEDRTFFITRKPCRRVRQGLCSDNLTSNHGSMVSNDRVRSKNFARMLLVEYPTFQKAYDLTVVRKMQAQCAFSRSFAVSHEGRLYYEGQDCGTVNSDGVPSFSQGYVCLKELFDAEASKKSSS